MAPSTPVSTWQDQHEHDERAQGGARRGSDWQALKKDLIALLDQVDHTQREFKDPTKGAGAAGRARADDLGEHHGSGAGPRGRFNNRRTAALRSVNEAVERFSHAEAPREQSREQSLDRVPRTSRTNPQDELQSAIAEIRSQMQRHALDLAQDDVAQDHADNARAPRPRHRTELAARFDAPSGSPDARPDRPHFDSRAAAPANDRGQFENINARFGDLTAAISGLTERLEHIEGDVRAARGDAASVHEISAQVSQLTEVVEMLAGAVGETGQVKRLEGQIAALASTIAEGQRPEISALGERIDDIAITVERLTDLQVQQIGRETQTRGESDTQHFQALSAVEESVRAVYDRVDAIERNTLLHPEDFNRLTAELAEISRVFRDGEGIRTPNELLARVDALTQRIGELQGTGAQLVADELRTAVETLRIAVVDATEPRFDALERRIEALSGELSERDAASTTPNGLEALRAQIQQLAARMDETGAQLENLSSQYASQPDNAQPDYEELATLVAQRTSQEIARNIGQENGLSAEHLNELENRLSALFTSGSNSGEGKDIKSLHQGIASVEDKIAKLEAALGKVTSKAAPKRKPARTESGAADLKGAPEPEPNANPAAAAVAAPAGNSGQTGGQTLGKTTEPQALPRTNEQAPPHASAPAHSTRSDAMPQDPLTDTPLRDEGFTGYELPAALAAEVDERLEHQQRAPKPGIRAQSGEDAADPQGTQLGHTDLRALAAKGFGSAKLKDKPETPVKPPADAGGAAQRDMDMSNVERPSKPKSSLFNDDKGAGERQNPPYAQGDRPQSRPEAQGQTPALRGADDDDARADRNTFIAAARRAAMRAETNQAEGGTNSLIARAFSRLQGQGETESTRIIEPKLGEVGGPAQGPKDKNPPAAQLDKKSTGLSAWLERVRTKSAEAGPRADEKPKKAKSKKAKFKQAKHPRVDTSDFDFPGTQTENANAKEDGAGFVPRNRRTLLLAALVVATSILAANLVVKRMTETPRDTASVDLGQAGTPAPETAPGATANTFNPAPMLDPQPTGSVSPQMSIQMPGSAQAQIEAGTQVMPGDTASAQPAAPRQVGETAPADTASSPRAGVDPIQTASIGDAASTPTTLSDGPVKLEMPPAQVGPLVLRQAAADGDARAQFEVAAIYTEGSIVAKDLKQAAVWYERAAAQGFAPAQYRLGNLYEHGEGVAKDLELAKLWYLRAAEAGNRMAMHNLASLLASGALGSQQFPTAAEWFGQAAARGMTDSQFNLGMLYARGLGVPQDLAQSYKWFALAARDGDKDAAQAREDIARSLDPQTLQKVKVEIANWHIAPINLAANFAPIGTWASNFDPGAKISDAKVVKRVQIALERLGFDVGSPDGLMGPKTGQAIKKFETATGMTPSGVVNPRLLAVLGSQPV